jgi:hypothetical protein
VTKSQNRGATTSTSPALVLNNADVRTGVRRFTAVAGSQEPERRFPHLQLRQVVESALRAHERGRTVKAVGPFYAFLSFAGRFAPRAVLRRMTGRVLRPAPPTESGSLDDTDQTEVTR